MDRNEIKKALYKEKPIAKLKFVDGHILRKGFITYDTILNDGTELEFEVDVVDIGNAPLDMEMDAKLLIRYLK